MTVPYTFATATTSIPLSQLDSNFATAITLGNTAIYLGNTTTSLGNLTLTNATISSVATTFPNSYLANSSLTLGTTNVSLGGTATSLANLTLSNVTISSGSINITNVSVSNITVTGGTIDNTPIGATTASTGKFTTLSASSQLNLTNASNYNLYASGVGANYMAGNLAVGSTLLLSLAGIGSNTNILAATYFWNRIPSSQSVATRGLLFTIDGIDYGRIYAPNGSSVAIQTGSGTLSDYLTINQSGVTSIGGTVGSESLRVTPLASAVNYYNITGGATGSSPYLQAAGSDANIHSQYLSKGTYGHIFNTGNAGNFQFYISHTANAVNYIQVSGNTTGGTPFFYPQGSDANIGVSYYTKGNANHYFNVNNATQFVVAGAASAVNYLQTYGGVTGDGPSLTSSGSDANINLKYLAKGNGYHFFYGNSAAQFSIAPTASAVNYIQATGGATGNPVVISSQGSDTNVDLQLQGQGTGLVRYGTYTAGVVVQAGYITIKDAAGNTRRLLVG